MQELYNEAVTARVCGSHCRCRQVDTYENEDKYPDVRIANSLLRTWHLDFERDWKVVGRTVYLMPDLTCLDVLQQPFADNNCTYKLALSIRERR